MKILLQIIFICFAAVIAQAQQSRQFSDFFINKTMRIDFYHTGTSTEEHVTLDHVYVYGQWAGSQKTVIQKLDLGRYVASLRDKQSGTLIFSKHFDSYFGEYQTSEPAGRDIWRTYHESILTPLPKDTVIFQLNRRNRDNSTSTIFRSEIDPGDVTIIRNEPSEKDMLVINILKNGKPQNKVDIVFLGEGYTREQNEKFKADLNRFTENLFASEPFRSKKNDFNVYGVLKPSIDSGVDEPRSGYFKHTSLSATFNSLGSERYLLTEDNRSVRDIASVVPYDAICIMVNHHRYGGGGIYNLFCTFTTDNQWSDYLLVHEFGHSFAGLADEYYTSETAYADFYPQGVEPLEANVTALLDINNVKWKQYLTPGIEVPTPWEKESFDAMDLKWQKERRELNNEIARLKKTKAGQQKIKEAENLYATKDREHAIKVSKYIAQSKFAGKIGVFEGAGYASRGLYRPMLDCIMFSKGIKPFCAVCAAAISDLIESYTQ